MPRLTLKPPYRITHRGTVTHLTNRQGRLLWLMLARPVWTVTDLIDAIYPDPDDAPYDEANGVQQIVYWLNAKMAHLGLRIVADGNRRRRLEGI